MPLPRPCNRCNKRFQPTGKGCRICDKCRRKSELNTAKKRAKLYYNKK